MRTCLDSKRMGIVDDSWGAPGALQDAAAKTTQSIELELAPVRLAVWGLF